MTTFIILTAILALSCFVVSVDRKRSKRHDVKVGKLYPKDKIIEWCNCREKLIDRTCTGIYCKTCKKPIKP